MGKFWTKIILLFSFMLIIALCFYINKTNLILKKIYPLKYKEYVNKYSKKYNLDSYFVYAVIKAESKYRQDAVSKSGAKGLMQLTDETAEWVAKKVGISNFEKNMIFDPEININLGCCYYSILLKEFNNDLDLSIIAYNAGNSKVKEWLKSRELKDDAKLGLKKIPLGETKEYLKRVKNYYEVYKKVYENDF